MECLWCSQKPCVCHDGPEEAKTNGRDAANNTYKPDCPYSSEHGLDKIWKEAYAERRKEIEKTEDTKDTNATPLPCCTKYNKEFNIYCKHYCATTQITKCSNNPNINVKKL